MNPVVIVHFLAGLVAVGASLPLIQGKVKMNAWYGVRIPAAFASETAWYDLNRYGGRLLLGWGVVLTAVAVVGAFLPRGLWIPYNLAALAVVFLGLALVMVKIYRYAGKREGS